MPITPNQFLKRHKEGSLSQYDFGLAVGITCLQIDLLLPTSFNKNNGTAHIKLPVCHEALQHNEDRFCEAVASAFRAKGWRIDDDFKCIRDDNDVVHLSMTIAFPAIAKEIYINSLKPKKQSIQLT